MKKRPPGHVRLLSPPDILDIDSIRMDYLSHQLDSKSALPSGRESEREM